MAVEIIPPLLQTEFFQHILQTLFFFLKQRALVSSNRATGQGEEGCAVGRFILPSRAGWRETEVCQWEPLLSFRDKLGWSGPFRWERKQRTESSRGSPHGRVSHLITENEGEKKVACLCDQRLASWRCAPQKGQSRKTIKRLRMWLVQTGYTESKEQERIPEKADCSWFCELSVVRLDSSLVFCFSLFFFCTNLS